MLSYELAKKLKDAGFHDKYKLESGVSRIVYRGDGTFVNNDNYINGEELFICPTLSELIEACGEDFFQLTKGSGVWYAEGDVIGTGKVVCPTPEEAVAYLWLELHKTN